MNKNVCENQGYDRYDIPTIGLFACRINKQQQTINQ